MPRFTRLALLCVCLIPLLSALGCGGSASASAALERPWEALPADVVGVAHFDVAGLLDSELYRALGLEDRLPEASDGKLQEFREATGFDFATDLESITIGGGYAGGASESPYYMIVRGKFDLQRIERYARASEEVDIETREGLTVYGTRSQEPTPTPPPVAAFLDTSTLLMASPADFAKLVRSVNGSAPSAASSSLVRSMPDLGGQVFLALQIPEEARSALQASAESGSGMLSGLQESFRHMETVFLTLDVSHDLELSLATEADTPESGKLVHDAAQGLLALGRMMAGQSPETMELLDQMTLRQDGRTVRLGLVLTRQQIEEAMEQAQSTPLGAGLGG
jgi:hypothetical protein